MRALHAERLRRGADPWTACPITLPQLRALGLIAASERGLSSHDLAVALTVGPSAITPLVDRLVERGFASRREDPRDRRIARLQATEAGAAVLERMHEVQTDVLDAALKQLNAAELETVAAGLDMLRAGVQRALQTTTTTTTPTTITTTTTTTTTTTRDPLLTPEGSTA
jgi:DNA-binding MarR family transcriptional regulator